MRCDAGGEGSLIRYKKPEGVETSQTYGRVTAQCSDNCRSQKRDKTKGKMALMIAFGRPSIVTCVEVREQRIWDNRGSSMYKITPEMSNGHRQTMCKNGLRPRLNIFFPLNEQICGLLNHTHWKAWRWGRQTDYCENILSNRTIKSPLIYYLSSSMNTYVHIKA
jgi:hypothetical protein